VLPDGGNLFSEKEKIMLPPAVENQKIESAHLNRSEIGVARRIFFRRYFDYYL